MECAGGKRTAGVRSLWAPGAVADEIIAQSESFPYMHGDFASAKRTLASLRRISAWCGCV